MQIVQKIVPIGILTQLRFFSHKNNRIIKIFLYEKTLAGTKIFIFLALIKMHHISINTLLKEAQIKIFSLMFKKNYLSCKYNLI